MYIIDFLQEFHMKNDTPLKLHMHSHFELTAEKGNYLLDVQPYQKLIDKLIYLTITRPYISYVVHILTPFLQKPTTMHMQAVKRVLCFLINTSFKGILLASSS